MNRSKKIFVFFVIVFVVLLAWGSYDISRRTTFPGSKPQLKERINNEILEEKVDSIGRDSTFQD